MLTALILAASVTTYPHGCAPSPAHPITWCEAGGVRWAEPGTVCHDKNKYNGFAVTCVCEGPSGGAQVWCEVPKGWEEKPFYGTLTNRGDGTARLKIRDNRCDSGNTIWQRFMSWLLPTCFER